jgi:GT2 family glycosyltransferase
VSAGRVAAVVVSFNVRELLLACLASLEAARARGELDDIVVVDNASADGSAQAARDTFPDISVLEAPNDGYGAGANVGIAATSGAYVLVLNPDTVVMPNAITRLADYLDQHPRCAVVGPRLRYPDGRIQPTRRRFPGRLTPCFESSILEGWWPANPWSRAFHMRDVPDDGPREVDWLVGAALCVRRAAIARAGGFDSAYRLYSEEVEWCWRIRRHGWTIDYLPCAEIMHHEAASTRQDAVGTRIEFDRSRIRLARQLHGASGEALARTAVVLNDVLLGGREALKWLLGHRRELRKQRVAFYVRAARAGLRR